jgi:hypothetical protein
MARNSCSSPLPRVAFQGEVRWGCLSNVIPSVAEESRSFAAPRSLAGARDDNVVEISIWKATTPKPLLGRGGARFCRIITYSLNDYTIIQFKILSIRDFFKVTVGLSQARAQVVLGGKSERLGGKRYIGARMAHITGTFRLKTGRNFDIAFVR